MTADPHGGHFADAKNKFLALADYAETFGENLVRVESTTMTDSGLRCRPTHPAEV